MQFIYGKKSGTNVLKLKVTRNDICNTINNINNIGRSRRGKQTSKTSGLFILNVSPTVGHHASAKKMLFMLFIQRIFYFVWFVYIQFMLFHTADLAKMINNY